MKWIIILAIIGVVIWLLKRNRGGRRRFLVHRSGEHGHDHHGRGDNGGNGGNDGNGGGE